MEKCLKKHPPCPEKKPETVKLCLDRSRAFRYFDLREPRRRPGWEAAERAGGWRTTMEDKYKYIFNETLRMSNDGFIVVDTEGVVIDISEC